MLHGARHPAIVTTLLLATIGTAACGSSEAASTRAACTEPGVGPDSIKVGLLFPNTGLLAETFSPSRSGVEARIGLANADGGINGRKIELEWRDDQSDPTANLTAARDLVENTQVFGIIEATAGSAGSADYLDTKGVPVTGLATDETWYAHANMFTVSSRHNYGPGDTVFGRFAQAEGGTGAFVLENTTSPSSRSRAAKLTASLAAAGIPVVGQSDYTAAATNPTRIAADIEASGADVIVGAIPGDGLATVLQEVRAAGIPIKVALGPDGYNPELLTAFGPAVAGMSTYTSYTPFELDSPALDRYHNAMVSYAPELANPDRATAIFSYIATDLFLHGLEVAGDCPNRARFINDLRAVDDYDAESLLPGTVDLDANAPAETCYYFLHVNATGTAFEVISGGDGQDGSQWCGTQLPG
jgi:ABC-type branched-subunit amino acid transport system substrate-binding protein